MASSVVKYIRKRITSITVIQYKIVTIITMIISIWHLSMEMHLSESNDSVKFLTQFPQPIPLLCKLHLKLEILQNSLATGHEL